MPRNRAPGARGPPACCLAQRTGVGEGGSGWSTRCGLLPGDTSNPNRANYDDSGIGDTSAIGCFPANGFGIHDMAGNVWEWTRSLWGSRWDEPDFAYPTSRTTRNARTSRRGTTYCGSCAAVRGTSIVAVPAARTADPRHRVRLPGFSGGVAVCRCSIALISVARRSGTLTLRLCSPRSGG